MLLLILFALITTASAQKAQIAGAGNIGPPKPPPPEPPTPEVPENPPANPEAQLLDLLTGTEPLDPSVYDAQPQEPGAGLTDPLELTCDFSSPCCWKNAEQGEDQFDFRLSREEPNDEVWNHYIGQGVSKPVPPYAVTGNAQLAATDTAKYKSCIIECSSGEIIVALTAWWSGSTSVDVCLVEVDDTGATISEIQCQTLANMAGDVVTLPAAKRARVVVVAKGFDSQEVAFVIIDDLNVDFTACPEETTEEPEPEVPEGDPNEEADQANCAKVNCDFSSDTCGFEDPPESELPANAPGHTNFEMHQKYAGNPLTGINNVEPQATDENFMAANFDETKTVAIKKAELSPVTEDRMIRWADYEATEGLTGKVCLNSLDGECAETKKDETVVGDREWKETEMLVPAGTSAIYVVGMHQPQPGARVGTYGIDSFEYLKADGSSICGGGKRSSGQSLDFRKRALLRRMLDNRRRLH